MHSLLHRVQSALDRFTSSLGDETEDLAGAIAVVDAPIAPLHRGRIKYQATYWFGQCDAPLAPGTLVRLIRRQGNTWEVKPLA